NGRSRIGPRGLRRPAARRSEWQRLRFGSAGVVSAAGVDLIATSVEPNRRARVLVAEDEQALQRAVARALRQAGFDVETPANGHAAGALLAASDFDAVVSD